MVTDRRPLRTALLVGVGMLLVLMGLVAPAATASADQVAPPARSEASASASPSASPSGTAPSGVVLVGTGDLHWTDIDRTATPTLWRLVSTGSVGSVSVRTAGAQTCPLDAWLTVSAGRRTVAPVVAAPGEDLPLDCVPMPQIEATGTGAPGPATVVGWDTLGPEAGATTENGQPDAGSGDAPVVGVPGALGGLVDAAGACSTAVGPGAALALARADGTVDRYVDLVTRLTEAELAACPVTVIDLGELGFDPEQRRTAISALDRSLAKIVRELPAGRRLVVAGLSGAVTDQGLPVVIDWRASGGRVAWLTSASTRRPGLVTLTDLSATVAAAAGAGVSELDGAPVVPGVDRRMSTERTVENRRYLTELTTTVTHLLPVFAAVVALAGLVVALALRRRRSLGAAGRRVVLAVLLVATAAPAGAFLATLSRWWVSSAPVVVASLWTSLAAVAVALTAWGLSRLVAPGPWRLAGAVALVTWVVLTVDGLTGTLLQEGSILGATATVGARFYGFGNMAFSVYAASALVLAGAVAARVRSRRAAIPLVALLGLITVAVDGWPGFGADVGGILALVPAFVVLLLGLTGRGVTGRRVLGALALAVAVTAILGIVDWAGPGPASHLGLFVQRVVDGQAWGLVAEKAGGAWATVANPVGAVAAVACVAAVLVLVGPWRPAQLREAYAQRPVLWRTVVAVVVVAVLGTLLNDSGIAVAVVVLALVGGMLGVSWVDDAWSARAGVAPTRATVRRTPAALVAVGGGMAAALLLGAAVLPTQVTAGDVTHGEGTPVVTKGTPLVVIGTVGLRWADVDRSVTPTLWALTRDGAVVGGLSPAVTGVDRRCLASGWLALSAGSSVLTTSRTAAGLSCLPWWVASTSSSGGAVGVDTGLTSAEVSGWTGLVGAQAGSAFAPRPGLLADTLAAAGVCSTAIGPGAALTLAGSDGTVRRYLGLDAALADPTGAFSCPVTVVDAGAAPYVSGTAAGTTADPAAPVGTSEGPERDAALTALDTTVRRVLAAVPSDATVLVANVGDASVGREWLGFGAVEASGLGSRYLSSPSTRWEGVARLLDVPTTILAAVGQGNPADFTGATLTAAGSRPADVSVVVDGLADLSTRDNALRGLSGQVTANPLVAALVLLALTGLVGPWLARRRPGLARRLLSVVDGLLLVLAALPIGLYLMTTWAWWRSGDPGTTMWLAMAGATLTVAGLAALAPRRPGWAAPAVVAGVTFAVLTLDALLGTPLHRGSPLGPSPTLGGRYYGFGNPTYSVYVAAALVASAALGWWLAARGHRWLAMLTSGAIGVTALLVDVLPGLGADVGGGLVLLPAAAMVVLAVGGLRVTWTRAGLIGAAGVLLVAGIGVLDWLRPADQRSHLGRFVQSVLDGTAWQTVSRKADYALASLGSGPVAWLTVALVVLGVVLVWPRSPLRARWYVRAEQAWPVLRLLVIGLLIAAAAGSVANDYGTRIATVLFAAAVPLLGLVVLRAADRDPPTH